MSVRPVLLLSVSLAAVAALAVNFLANPLNLQPHRFTFSGRFLDFPDLKGPQAKPMTFEFFRDDPTSFDGDVRGALAAYDQQAQLHPLGRLGPENRPYYAHPGYQAFLLAVLQRVTNGGPAAIYSNGLILFAILTSLTLTVLLTAIWREFGPASAISVFVLLMLSDWLVFIGASAYWASFTIYLPMATAWLIYPAVVRKQVAVSYMVLLLSLLVFVRCTLGGYEFISNILLGFTVPVVYYRVKSGSSLPHVAREVALLSAGGAVGFVLAFAAHCCALGHQLGSWRLAATTVIGRATPRMVGLTSGPLQITQADRLPAFLQHAPLDLVKAGAYLSNSIVTVPFITGLHVLLAFAVAMQILLFALYRQHLANPQGAARVKVRAMFISLLWSFVCGCSWLVLMPGHMRPHVYFATIVFYVPWLITLQIFAAVTVSPYAGLLARTLCSWPVAKVEAVFRHRLRGAS